MTFLQVLAVILAIFGLIGSVVPALPGPPVGWLAVLCAYFCGGTNTEGEPMTLTLLFVLLGVTVVVSVLDYIVPAFLTKATGGHKAASWGAILGLIAGIFFTPVGMIAGSLLGAFLGELLVADSGVWTAFKASIGAFLGFVCGTLLKLLCSALLAYYVFIYAF